MACAAANGALLVSRGPLGVDKYSDDGVFLGNLIAPGAGGLGDAQGVAQLPGGDLLVGDFLNSNVLRFDANGTFLGVFASGADLDFPNDVVYGPDGNVYVASGGGIDNIAKLNGVTGAPITASFTSGNVTPIGGPQYIAFGPTMALSDVAGHVFRFDASTGVHIATGTFDNPEGVVFDALDNLYIAQRISDNIIRSPAGGGPLEIVVAMGGFTGSPADIGIGPNGLLYVSASQIYRFDISGGGAGVFVDSFGTGGEFITFIADVPEPGTNALLLLGACALFALRRRV
jgi:hypothetical protein